MDRRALADLFADQLPQLHCAGHCTRIFELDPIVCRLWGRLKRLECPYGCQPDRWLSGAEADALLRAEEAVRGFA